MVNFKYCEMENWDSMIAFYLTCMTLSIEIYSF